MNKGRNYLFVLFLIGGIYISCKKETNPPPGPPSATVPMGFRPTAWGFNFYNYLNTYMSYYTVTYKNDTLGITLAYATAGNPDPNEYWTMQFYAKKTGTYGLANKNKGTYYIYNNFMGNTTYGYFYTDSVHTGKVVLTELDTIKHLVSATFWYACERTGSYRKWRDRFHYEWVF